MDETSAHAWFCHDTLLAGQYLISGVFGTTTLTRAPGHRRKPMRKQRGMRSAVIIEGK